MHHQITNFRKVFLENDNDEDFIAFEILRVSCACHTVLLALKDLHDEDQDFRELVRISLLKLQQINKIRIKSYPPVQS